MLTNNTVVESLPDKSTAQQHSTAAQQQHDFTLDTTTPAGYDCSTQPSYYTSHYPPTFFTGGRKEAPAEEKQAR